MACIWRRGDVGPLANSIQTIEILADQKRGQAFEIWDETRRGTSTHLSFPQSLTGSLRTVHRFLDGVRALD